MFLFVNLFETIFSTIRKEIPRLEGKITKNTLPKFNWINNASYFKRKNIYVWKRITDELDESKRGKARGMQFCNIRINRGNRVCVSNIGKFSSPPLQSRVIQNFKPKRSLEGTVSIEPRTI